MTRKIVYLLLVTLFALTFITNSVKAEYTTEFHTYMSVPATYYNFDIFTIYSNNNYVYAHIKFAWAQTITAKVLEVTTFTIDVDSTSTTTTVIPKSLLVYIEPVSDVFYARLGQVASLVFSSNYLTVYWMSGRVNPLAEDYNIYSVVYEMPLRVGEIDEMKIYASWKDKTKFLTLVMTDTWIGLATWGTRVITLTYTVSDDEIASNAQSFPATDKTGILGDIGYDQAAISFIINYTTLSSTSITTVYYTYTYTVYNSTTVYVTTVTSSTVYTLSQIIPADNEFSILAVQGYKYSMSMTVILKDFSYMYDITSYQVYTTSMSVASYDVITNNTFILHIIPPLPNIVTFSARLYFPKTVTFDKINFVDGMLTTIFMTRLFYYTSSSVDYSLTLLNDQIFTAANFYEYILAHMYNKALNYLLSIPVYQFVLSLLFTAVLLISISRQDNKINTLIAAYMFTVLTSQFAVSTFMFYYMLMISVVLTSYTIIYNIKRMMSPQPPQQ